MSITHEFVSPAAASPDPNKVDGPKWNAPHVLSGGSTGQVLTRDTAFDPPAGEGWKWAPVFPVGTRMVFDQDTAPVGWTRDVTITDRVIRIVNGARADGGSWTLSGLTVQGHALTVAEMPAHTHGLAGTTGTNWNVGAGVTINGAGTAFQTNSAGSGQAHSHGLTSDGTWRPLHRDMIVAVKD